MTDLIFRNATTGEVQLWDLNGRAKNGNATSHTLAGFDLIGLSEFDEPIHSNPTVELTSANGSNTVVIAENTETVKLLHVTDLTLFVNIKSLSNAATEPDFTLNKKANLWIKRGANAWLKFNEILLYNREPLYTENLLSFITAQDEFVLEPSAKLGISIDGAGSALLTGTDRLVVMGQAHLLNPLTRGKMEISNS